MRFFSALLFLFWCELSFSQIHVVSNWSTPNGHCSGHQIGLRGFNFGSPMCSSYWLFDDDICPGHASPGFGTFTSPDSSIIWSGNFVPASVGSGSTTLFMEGYGDTMFCASTGWPPVFYNYLARSVDCGNHWNKFVDTANVLPEKFSVYNGRYGYGYNSYGQLCRIDHDTCYSISAWLPQSVNSISQFDFVDDSLGFVLTNDTIFKTTNAGATWFISLSDTVNYFTELYFINDTVIISRGTHNIYYRSNDLGVTWVSYSYPMDIVNLFAFHPDSMYGLSYSYYSGHTFLMRSSNSGITWDSIPFIIPGYNIVQLKMFNRSLGYILANKNFPDESKYILHMHNDLNLVYADEIFDIENQIFVFPNPFSSDFKISGITNGHLQVFDCVGNLVFEKQHIYNETLIDFPLTKGFYFARIYDTTTQTTIPLIKSE
jgi:hypothetical protein